MITEAELVRKIAEQVAARLANSPAPQTATEKKPGCGCGCKRSTFTEVAEKEGHCEIFPRASAEQTLSNGFVPIGISARHVHVTQEQLEVLFGKGHQLKPMKPLKQHGQFAAEETVSVIGPRGRAIERIRILGPCRNDTQVELSQTDCIAVGVDAPVRASGDHRDTPGILIVGPAGHLAIGRGVIRANRHIHLHSSEAAALNLRDNDLVMVKISGDKPVIYYNVQVRVSERFSAEMHLDTDDANAVGLPRGAMAQIVRRAEDVVLCGKMP